MAYLIVRIKPTTIDKVVSLMNKLEKYDIVESVESHNDPAEQDKICPFCSENNFDEIGLEIHLANYCMVDQSPKLNSFAYRKATQQSVNEPWACDECNHYPNSVKSSNCENCGASWCKE